MRGPVLFLACAVFAAAQSHPSWWTYASPDATGLVGIDWQTVRTSPFADPIEAELWSGLGFPELACLRNARQIVISSPDLLALVSGDFPVATVRSQAAKKGMKAMTYRGVDMWFGKGVLSLALLNEQLIMIGDPQTLQNAVDRSLTDSKTYSPLLARAAQFAQKDLWAVSVQLPDALVSRFVPLELAAQRFEGSLSFRDGLAIEANFLAGSPPQASASSEKLRRMISALPAIARGVQVKVEKNSILMVLTITREQMVAALKGPEPVAKPIETVRVETPKRVEQVVVEKIEPPKPVAAVKEKPVEKTPPKPQVIRIVGLDDGPKEIVLPADKPEKQNP